MINHRLDHVSDVSSVYFNVPVLEDELGFEGNEEVLDYSAVSNCQTMHHEDEDFFG